MKEVKLVNAEAEHWKPIIVGVSFLRYDQVRMWELYDHLFRRQKVLCHWQSSKIWNGFWLPLFSLNRGKMEDFILLEKNTEWNRLRSKKCTEFYSADATDNFFKRLAAIHTRSTTGENPDSSKRNLDVQRDGVFAAKRIVAMIEGIIKTNSAAKGSAN